MNVIEKPELNHSAYEKLWQAVVQAQSVGGEPSYPLDVALTHLEQLYRSRDGWKTDCDREAANATFWHEEYMKKAIRFEQLNRVLKCSGPSREICSDCNEVSRIGFSVSDSIWNEAVGDNRILCLRCFTQRADFKYVEWDKDIQFFPVSKVTHRECADSWSNQLSVLEVQLAKGQDVVIEETRRADDFEHMLKVSQQCLANALDARRDTEQPPNDLNDDFAKGVTA